MRFLAVAFALLALSASARAAADEASIKQAIIRESIAHYSGSCPCPYSTARNGSSCGRRSAYSRAGGEEPICYPEQILPYMVREYRERTY